VSRIDRKTTKTESSPVWVGGGDRTGVLRLLLHAGAVGTYTTETNEFVVETVLYSSATNGRTGPPGATPAAPPTKFANDIAKPVADSLKESGSSRRPAR
jgi:hypothetical protein